MAINNDIENALKQIISKQTNYSKMERYYKGDHDLAFATEKFKNAFGELFREFSLNLCIGVCDAVKDKLRIKNFNIEGGNKNLALEAWKIWQSNRMGLRSSIIHKEAIIKGDSYCLVWIDPNDKNKKVTFYPQKAEKCMVHYDEETPGKILYGAKVWSIPDPTPGAKPADRKIRLNMYYADKTEKYISKKKTTSIPNKVDDFESFKADGSEIVTNPYNQVPLFHFPNNADIENNGSSELIPAIPVQNGLNKTVLDLMVAMEFVSYPQRWATGIEAEYDDDGQQKAMFMAGVERLWLSESSETKFGSFTTGDLRQFLEVKESFRVDMASTTGTPLYYFIQTGANFPSGESLKKAETRFINKVTDRMEVFGAIWEEMMAFALRIENKGSDIRLFTDWEDPAPASEKEKLGNIILKKEIGIDDEQALIEADYGEEDIKAMLERKKIKAEESIHGFNAGEDS